jgi:glycosyltransferase involved in cell wall biosynthesis
VQTPTFSIVVETENLANGELSDLESCLASIVAQDLQTHRPNEVILVDSGQIDAGILDDIRARYPWIRVHVSSTPLHYYDAKMLGAQLATGELIAFADSDMVYEKGWLRGQLALFERQEVDFVSGETRVEISGPYTFSVATTWLFPVTYSPAKEAQSLVANNATVRRAALLTTPFPSNLPLYRAQIVLHGRLLRRLGKTIVHARARGFHAPPAGAQEWALRFAISGADSVLASTYDFDNRGGFVQRSTLGRRVNGWWRACARKLGSTMLRTAQAVVSNPARIVYLPIALPISAAALLLFVGGGLTAVLGSQAAYRRMRAFEIAAGGVHDEERGSMAVS